MTKKLCFVIGPIGSEGSVERERADILFDYVIKNVLDDKHISAIRADQISQPGLITHQIINHIKDADFLIADLHGKNANVFYELALAHAMNKNVIQFFSKSSDLPFDVKDLRSIRLDVNNIPSYENAKEQLKNQVQSVLDNPTKIQNPLSVAVDLNLLAGSENTYERTVGLLFDEVSTLKSTVDKIAMNQRTDIRRRKISPMEIEFENTRTSIDRALSSLKVFSIIKKGALLDGKTLKSRLSTILGEAGFDLNLDYDHFAEEDHVEIFKRIIHSYPVVVRLHEPNDLSIESPLFALSRITRTMITDLYKEQVRNNPDLIVSKVELTWEGQGYSIKFY